MTDMTLRVRDNRKILRLVTGLHMALYRLTGGVIGGLISGVPNLLLTTTGRVTGKQFTTPLFYLPDGPDLVVVASYGGHPQDPQWWKNLQANPMGEVLVGHHRWKVVAAKGSDELKQRLWPVFCRYYPDYEVYQSRTERNIPLVVLSPLP